MLFGLLPALQVSRADVNTTLKESARLPGLGATNRLRFALVAGEVAFSMIALAAAGLLVRSVREAQRIDPGFEVERVALMNYNLRGLHEGPKVRLFHQRILEELSAAPDVRAAAVSDRAPLAPGSAHTIMVAGQTPPPGAMGFLVDTASVSPGYFDVLGIEVVRGRAFSAADRPDSRPVAIVNETMASRFWPDRDPIGGRFQSRSMTRPVEIVGVVRNAKYETLGEPAQPFFYLPILQQQSSSPGPTGLLVGSRGDPSAAVASVRAALRRLDPAIPLTNITTIASRVDEALWAPRTLAALVAAFGAIVLALGAIGIYGVMAVTVVQRRQEIGLRMALGALPGTILRMVLGRGLAATLAGVVVGVAIALPYAGLLRSLLFGISPWDPPTFLSVAAALIAVALVACYIPARRAARMDPAMTLKG
jgi:predicted permease